MLVGFGVMVVMAWVPELWSRLWRHWSLLPLAWGSGFSVGGGLAV